MSILIRGMEMPKGCFFCICNKHLDPDTDMCILTRDAFDSTFRVVEHRRDNCPLIPVPPHGRLIDADAMIRDIEKSIAPSWYIKERNADMVKFLSLEDTIIPAEEG